MRGYPHLSSGKQLLIKNQDNLDISTITGSIFQAKKYQVSLYPIRILNERIGMTREII
jgi:hypothetical protein